MKRVDDLVGFRFSSAGATAMDPAACHVRFVRTSALFFVIGGAPSAQDPGGAHVSLFCPLAAR